MADLIAVAAAFVNALEDKKPWLYIILQNHQRRFTASVAWDKAYGKRAAAKAQVKPWKPVVKLT